MWILLSFIYAFTNAFYTTYNDTRHYNGYILGIWRGFGVSLLSAPLLLTFPIHMPPAYFTILAIQGLLIGIYDSHIFFASAKFSSHSSSGFMTTTVLITAFLWWSIEINEFKSLLLNPPYFITLMLILISYTISYWQMMRVHINKDAETYLYPAVFALALMSIATRFIAIHGGSMYRGIVYYLTVSCFISGLYNSLMYFKTRNSLTDELKPEFKDGLKLILLSTILIAAKTAAMRLCENPAYVVAILLTSPIIAATIKIRQLKPTPAFILNLSLLVLLILLVN